MKNTEYFKQRELTPEFLMKQRKKELRHLRSVIRRGCFLEFLYEHRKALTTILLFIGLIISFIVLNHLGEQWRGYKAVGGEILVFLLPFIIVVVRDNIIDLIDLLKKR